MYKIEKLNNFRFLYALLASKSSHPLQIEDTVSEAIHTEIRLIGEFADVSYSLIDLERVFKHMELLLQTHFPLEGYEAVTSSKLILPFEGSVANVKGLVAYRPMTKQLVVGICGTHTLMQVLYDMNSLFQRHTKGGQAYRVHSGFMSMYTGLEALALKGIRKGLEEEEVEELVVRPSLLQTGRLDNWNSSSLDILWGPPFHITLQWSYWLMMGYSLRGCESKLSPLAHLELGTKPSPPSGRNWWMITDPATVRTRSKSTASAHITTVSWTVP